MIETKPTNPKDAVGIKKAPFSVLPQNVLAEVGLALLEGARKYGRHNYRVAGVRASVYFDAAVRHLSLWWEGQDIDPDSGLHHVVKAMACLVVIRDAQLNGMATDDRPPAVVDQEWMAEANRKAAAIIERYPDAQMPFTQARLDAADKNAARLMICEEEPFDAGIPMHPEKAAALEECVTRYGVPLDQVS